MTIYTDIDKLLVKHETLIKDVKALISQVYTWSGRPSKDGAKLLREAAESLETKLNNNDTNKEV